MVEFDEIQTKTNQTMFICLESIINQTKHGLVFPTQTKPNPIWFSLCREKGKLGLKIAS